jgi:hypothetical protein
VRRGRGHLPFFVHVLTGVDPQQLPTLAAPAPYWTPAHARDSYDIGVKALLAGLTR